MICEIDKDIKLEITAEPISSRQGYDHWEPMEMPDVRADWRAAKQARELKGCGLHKNFSYDDLAEFEQSLFERRLLADVPTEDVNKFKEERSRASVFKNKRFFINDNSTPEEKYTNKDKISKALASLLKEIDNINPS